VEFEADDTLATAAVRFQQASRVDQWDVSVRGARRLLDNFTAHREQAFLYRRLTTLRSDVPLTESLDDLRWKGPQEDFEELCQELGANELPDRLPSWG
jgi:5'-3' exonuclease